MKQFNCHIITFILLLGCIGFYQKAAYADTAEVEINGQIGGKTVNEQAPKEPTGKPNTNLAKPKQSHITLRRFPNNGSIIDTLTPIGILLLLIYILLLRWKAHRNKYS